MADRKRLRRITCFEGMKDAVLYIHGKGGSAAECEHYRPLFPDSAVFGLDYQTFTPWETRAEIHAAVEELKAEHKSIILIANSIGAFFSMNAGIDAMIQKAYFISPIVDMERLIRDMMAWADVTEAELRLRGVVHTEFGEDLAWDYLSYVRNHPIVWTVPTQILYGGRDNLQSSGVMRAFSRRFGCALTVAPESEHAFMAPGDAERVGSWLEKSL